MVSNVAFFKFFSVFPYIAIQPVLILILKLIRYSFVIFTLWFVQSICNSYKEIYNVTYRTLQSIGLINLYNVLLRCAGTTYLRKKALN